MFSRMASEHSSLRQFSTQPPACEKIRLPALSAPRLPTTPLASQLTATARCKTPTCASSPIPSKFEPDARAFHLNEQPTKTPRPLQSSTRARCRLPCARKTVLSSRRCGCATSPRSLSAKGFDPHWHGPTSRVPSASGNLTQPDLHTFFRSTKFYPF